MFKRSMKVLVATLFAGYIANASALLITSTGDNSVDFEIPCDVLQAAGCEGLLATGSITVSGFNSSQLTMLITLENDSIGPLTQIRLTAFGFGITPDVTGVTFVDVADNGITAAALNGVPPNNFPNDPGSTIDVCAYAGVNCSGGGGGPTTGLLPGESDTFTLLLDGTFGSTVSFDFLGARFQTEEGSFTFQCRNGDCGGGGPGGELPEPNALWLLGMGLVALAVARRRKPRL